MTGKRYTLSKDERLHLKRHQDVLFDKGQSFVAYPLRLVYLCTDTVLPARVSMMISVPKKKFKRAVKRNRIKRLIREAYRIRKYELIEPLTEKNKSLLMAFLFLDKELPSFAVIEKAMKKAMRLILEKEQLKEVVSVPFKKEAPVSKENI